MLDHLITELDKCFEETAAGIVECFEETAAGIVGELAQFLPSELVSSSVQLNPSPVTSCECERTTSMLKLLKISLWVMTD